MKKVLPGGKAKIRKQQKYFPWQNLQQEELLNFFEPCHKTDQQEPLLELPSLIPMQ